MTRRKKGNSSNIGDSGDAGNSGGGDGNSPVGSFLLDTDVFIVPVSDEKGHSVHLPCRCQPEWARQIDIVVASKRFPYVSRGDFLRHAVMRHFNYLEELAGQGAIPRSTISQINIAVQLLQDDARCQAFEGLAKLLEDRVNYHLSQGSAGEARRHVLMALSCVDGMADGYWRDRWGEVIRGKYEKLLESGRVAKLGRNGDE